MFKYIIFSLISLLVSGQKLAFANQIFQILFKKFFELLLTNYISLKTN